eukprot:scaffold8466_cov41-Cyclotella_meneghiniana.AAC.1
MCHTPAPISPLANNNPAFASHYNGRDILFNNQPGVSSNTPPRASHGIRDELFGNVSVPPRSSQICKVTTNHLPGQLQHYYKAMDFKDYFVDGNSNEASDQENLLEMARSRRDLANLQMSAVQTHQKV